MQWKQTIVCLTCVTVVFPQVFMMCKPSSLHWLSLPSSVVVVVNAFRRHLPVNKSDKRRAAVASKSHWIPIRVTLQERQTCMWCQISKCSFMLLTDLDICYKCVHWISTSHIFNWRQSTIWAVAPYCRDRLNWGCVYSLSDCAFLFFAFTLWLFGAATSKIW